MTNDMKIKTKLTISELKVIGLENVSNKMYIKIKQDSRRKIKTNAVLPSNKSAIFNGEYTMPCKVMKNLVKSRGSKHILTFYVRSVVSNDKYNTIGLIDIDLCNTYHYNRQYFDIKLKKCSFDAHLLCNIKFENKMRRAHDEPNQSTGGTNMNFFADLQFLKLSEDQLHELEKEVDMVISELKS